MKLYKIGNGGEWLQYYWQFGIGASLVTPLLLVCKEKGDNQLICGLGCAAAVCTIDKKNCFTRTSKWNAELIKKNCYKIIKYKNFQLI